MTITVLSAKNYFPEYDDEKGKYYDKSPYTDKMDKELYKCGCKNDCLFNRQSEFNKHIKLKTHIKWVSSYVEPDYIKEINNYKKKLNMNDIEIRKYKYELNMKLREIKELKDKLRIRTEELIALKDIL